MLIFWLCSTSDVGQTGQWTQTPSATPLQPKKMKCSFLDYVHFWWSAWLIDELEPHLPPLSYQKNEMLNFWLRSTSDDQPSWSIDSKSICQPSPANKMKCFFLDYVHFWWSARLADGLKPHLPPLSSQRNEMLIFWLRSTLDDQLGWLMDSNPIHHPSPAKKMKCYFLDYVQLLMIGWAGQWTQNPSATHLQPIKWNASFWIVFTSDDKPGWLMDSNPICHPSPAKKWNASFWITFNFWWLAGLVNGLKPHSPPLCSQRNEMLIFGLCSTSDDQLGWLMDSNPIHHPSPANKMKCSIFDYVQLLMIGWAGPWIQKSSASSLQLKKWNATFWIMFNFWWSAGLVNGLKTHLPPLSSQ